MMQKLLIGGLALTIVAVIGFGLIDAGRSTQDAEPITSIETTVPTDAASNEPEATSSIEVTSDAAPIMQAQGSMGDPWQADGTISVLDDFGFTLTTEDGDFYVELGQPTYWQAQDVALAEGDIVSVDGYNNGDMIHARIITVGDAELVLRNESGQPMWASGSGQSSGQQTADGNNQFQVEADDWVTLTGTIAAVINGQVTLNVDDGSTLALQMGRPDFWQSQGITLEVDDPVEVLGFWSGEQFMAGDIRKTETGETIMLRDPNGRQLWGGPGRNGQGQGQGQGGGQGQGQGGGQGQGQGGGGQRGNGQQNNNQSAG